MLLNYEKKKLKKWKIIEIMSVDTNWMDHLVAGMKVGISYAFFPRKQSTYSCNYNHKFKRIF